MRATVFLLLCAALAMPAGADEPKTALLIIDKFFSLFFFFGHLYDSFLFK